jgi:8-oxo-dGTP pyrophosphatase MutT (NUDIX family)
VPLDSLDVRLKALVWIVRPGAGGRPEVLLLERPERRGGGEHPVTGKADSRERPAACAEREAHEETGLRGELVELGIVHRYRGAKGDFEEHAFLLRVEKHAEPVLSSEHVAFRWATPEQARAAVHWKAHRDALDAVLIRFGAG